MSNELTRERVRQYRHNQAKMGRVRIELYLDKEVISAIKESAEDREDSINATIKSLLLFALRFAGRVHA